MTKSNTRSVNDQTPPKLKIPLKEAQALFQTQIKKGEELLEDTDNYDLIEEFDEVDLIYERNIWDDFNRALMVTVFDSDKISMEYSEVSRGQLGAEGAESEIVGIVYDDVRGTLSKLKSISNRLELYEETSRANVPAEMPTQQRQSFRKVFVVHGHDEALKQQACRLIEKLGLEPIVLHEKPNEGKTLIEKFVEHSDVAFALILLTPDDEARSKDTTEEPLMSRARQNVILELGFFIGRLGREKVCSLLVKGVEIPTDMSGVVYVEVDDKGAWKYKLANEMKACGLSVDLNKVG